MKKLGLLMMSFVFLFTSCDIEDDGPRTTTVLAKVTDIDLPEYFEEGESYDIEVTYVLPTACHVDRGVTVGRGSNNPSSEDYLEIYIGGLANVDADMVECELEDDDLEETGEFTLKIDKDETYTFFLWQSYDVDGENVYTEIEVPVGEPGDDDDDDDETEE